MILIDYSQIAIASIFAFKREMKEAASEEDKKNLIRHIILSSIKNYKKQYESKYGELIICCDGKNYWRKKAFPYYKASRKKSREDSDIDWKFIFDTMAMVREELKEYFPYKVMHIDEAESDDIIAVLAKQTQEFGMHQEVMIISSDNDFIQLQDQGNVSQFSPLQRKQIKANKTEIHKKIIEHIVKGDPGDGIPNILSRDDIFVNGEDRQKPISSKRLQEFIDNGFLACKTEEERRNYSRNSILVNFKFIPEELSLNIINQYNNYRSDSNKQKILKFLIDNRCRLLIDDIEQF